MTTKVLNLYAGIGGNRKLGEDVEVTAVEWDEEKAEVYKDHFPDDEVVVEDAHEYLLEHFSEFDFVWSSPPCPTHSSLRKNFALNDERRNIEPVYPDMKLYQEVIFLKHHFDGDWVIENVDPYYDPLLKPKKVSRHLFWSNFVIPDANYGGNIVQPYTIDKLESELGFDLSGYTFQNTRKDQVLKNCVHPKLGKHVFEAATKNRQSKLFE